MMVKCIDNTLAADGLDVVTKVHEYDGYYTLAGLDGRFSISRFVPVTPEEVALGYTVYRGVWVQIWVQDGLGGRKFRCIDCNVADPLRPLLCPPRSTSSRRR